MPSGASGSPPERSFRERRGESARGPPLSRENRLRGGGPPGFLQLLRIVRASSRGVGENGLASRPGPGRGLPGPVRRSERRLAGEELAAGDPPLGLPSAVLDLDE